MAKWLSSSRKKRIRDIRSFIPVHGKILKPASTSLSHESSPGADPVSSETLGTHVVAAWATSGAKQLSLVQLNKKATALAEGKRAKVPASSFSTGIRRKVALTGSTNSKKEETVTGRGMLEDKENFSDHMLSQTSPPLCHRMNGHKRLLQSRISVNTSTANVDNSELSPDKTNSKQLPLTLAASEPISTASPPNKRLRTGQYCSSRKSPSHQHGCGNYVKVVCSHGKDISVDSFELHDNRVKPITQGCKQSKSCGSSQDVQIIHTSVDCTLQSAEVSHVNTLPTKDSNPLPNCTNCVDNTNVAAEDPILSSRSEDGSLGLLWDSLEESIYASQERSRTFSNSDGNNIDTDELLAELSNCEKIV